MTPSQPAVVSFGLLATTCAMKARRGQLLTLDRLQLALGALQASADLPAARDITLAFFAEYSADPAQAGVDLQEAVRVMAGLADQASPDDVMSALEGEAARFGWQDRKDCGDG